MGRLIRILAGGLALLAVAGGFLVIHLIDRLEEPGPLVEEVSVVIPRGAGVEAIGRRLAEAGVIQDSWLFSLAARVTRSQRALKAGEYAFNPGISPRDVIDQLVEGRIVVRRVTVPEGLTVVEIIDLLEAADGLEGSVTLTPEDGALMPETYHYSLGDSRDEIIARMQRKMQEAMAELWPQRDEDLPIATPEEALVLASIVEKETAVPSERPHVAGVFHNRLRRGMRLQSDPTVVYAVSGGKGPIGRPLRRSDLRLKNPYNTYEVAGLPPGPIANPGRESIEAVLKPMTTKNLYFVADGTGGHAFAETLAEHNRNVAKWRKIERARRAAE